MVSKSNILNIRRIFSHIDSCTQIHRQCSSFAYVPKHNPCDENDVQKLQTFVNNSKRMLVITGAGISTESGIPDYRSEGVGVYATTDKRPVQMKDFLSSAQVRQSYWARNYCGWPKFSSFLPNYTHEALSRWEMLGKIGAVVTQNVDRLHQKAGSLRVYELHGSNFQVICLSCQNMVTRASFQERLKSINSLDFHSRVLRPDGDVDLTLDEVKTFKIPPCERCGGNMKPYIVFFGDNVPKQRVEAIRDELTSCDSVLAIGTSLHVYSSYRFILQAVDLKIPIAILNIGPTRGDKHASLKINARCGEVLPKILI